MNNIKKASRSKRELFVFYSRPLFRTCEIFANHAVRIIMKKSALQKDDFQYHLTVLNENRIKYQHDLNVIGGSHSQVCADCKGKCCGGVRERDAFIDRIIQDPKTPHLSQRRKTGELTAYKLAKEDASICIKDAKWVDGHCPELTIEGCKIPYELRPIQCTAYFCRKTIDELSPEECDTGIKALAGLMKVQLKTLRLALKSRLGG
jgi:hypothetical protein